MAFYFYRYESGDQGLAGLLLSHYMDEKGNIRCHCLLRRVEISILYME
jgi:hypothetical protein